MRAVPLLLALAVVLGLLPGSLNGAILRTDTGTLGLTRIATMPFVLVTLASALIDALENSLASIAVRVTGSRIAAAGLSMFGRAMR